MPMTAAELKRVRKVLGISQRELAELIGVSRESVARWEAGTRHMTEPIARLVWRFAEERKPKAR